VSAHQSRHRADPTTPLPPELDPRGRRPLRRRRGGLAPGLRLGVRVLAALLSLGVLLGNGYAWATFRQFTSNVTRIDAIAPRDPHRHDLDGIDQNILLVGDDHRPPGASAALLRLLNTQQDGGGVNTDTMMVLHIPADGSKATAISFPRDSWVNIPGFGMNKLNAAFNYGTENGGGDAGGARMLIKVIQTMTGLTIDHFVRVSMVGFYTIAKALGPLSVCLNAPAHDSYSGTNLPAGVSYLNAVQALSFVRQRHNLPRGDLDREVRQQYFLSTAFRKVASAGTLLNPLKLQHLLSAVSSSLETDPGLDLLKFAQQFQNLSAGKVRFATIPITGTPTITVGGTDVSIVAVDWAALPGFIASVIGLPPAYTSAVTVSPNTVTATVLNGSGTDRAATTNTTALTQIGFHTGTPASADTTTVTTIEYPAGMESQAKTLASYVPGAVPTLSTTVHTLTLLLGTDGHHVTTPTSKPHPAAGPPTASSAPAQIPNSPTRAFNANDCIN
jgi:LCP family protein required for cell wall assembly